MRSLDYEAAFIAVNGEGIAERKVKESEIEREIAWKGKVKEFVDLANLDDLEIQIQQTEKEIDILKRQSVIQSLALFSKVELDELKVDRYLETFAKELDDVSLDVESRINNHIESCLDSNGEIWLESGYKYFDGEVCPFCGQSVSQTEMLLKAYKDYFSEAYADLKKKIKTQRMEIDEYFSQEKVLQLQQNFEENEAAFDRWVEYIDGLKKFAWEFDTFLSEWNLYQEQFVNLFNEKIAQPLEKVGTATEQEKILTLYNSIHQTIVNFNAWVDRANNDAISFRSAVGKGDLASAEERLVYLDAVRQRYLPHVDEIWVL